MNNFLKNFEAKNYDIVIYAILIFIYGLGWDFVRDQIIDIWSIIGVVSYTAFVMLLLARSRNLPPQPGAGEHLSKISRKKDVLGKIVLAVVLYALLLYKLIQGFL